ncbi:hypothetical protein KJ762_06205 [bacterium]|nr:hypothetical protein [bacterium]MBU1064692.1 hypothetical protein [bacterium]MBU1634087.1 hypothetical protein [bacterium]MBU1872548.1 hypothetical protein [bacterium]
MNVLKHWILLLFFGFVWGIFEVVIGETMFGQGLSYASAWLIIWAVFVLAMARGVLNKPGSSTVIGLFAGIFKLANTSPFFCHLLAIFIIGMTFDVFSTVLMKYEHRVSYRSSLSGLLTVYAGRALFALMATYIMRWEYWTTGGVAYIYEHIFISGTFAALIAILVVPLGYSIGVNGIAFMERRPVLSYAGVAMAVVCICALGRIIG